jgi:hypothetical protein
MKPGGDAARRRAQPGQRDLEGLALAPLDLECPRHVILYSPNMLRKLLSDMAFSVFTVLHETVTMDCPGASAAFCTTAAE